MEQEIQTGFITVGGHFRVTSSCVDEHTGFDLKGLGGIVRQIYDPEENQPDPILLVEWTADSLRKMPDRFIRNRFEREVNWTTEYLSAKYITPTLGNSSEIETEWEKNTIGEKLLWDEFGAAAHRIRSVFNDSNANEMHISPYQLWEQYLQKNLRLPLKMSVIYDYEENDGPIRVDNHVLMKALAGWSHPLGIFAEIQHQDRTMILPLQDLEPTAANRENSAFLVDAYQIWLLCRA